MMNNEIAENDKRKRMKNEIKFARDSSTSLPKSDPIFRVMVTLPNKKRRDKTPAEFAEALKALLKKRLDVSKEGLSIDTFKNSLKNVLSQSQVYYVTLFFICSSVGITITVSNSLLKKRLIR